MSFTSLISQLRRSFKKGVTKDSSSLLLNDDSRATTIPLDRSLTQEEYAIAEWLLLHAKPPALNFLPQLAVARVTGQCSCGCPTVNLHVPEETTTVEPRDNPIGDAVGYIDGKMVGVMLLQHGGHLTCLEVYDLSDIAHPYGLPNLNTLHPFF